MIFQNKAASINPSCFNDYISELQSMGNDNFSELKSRIKNLEQLQDDQYRVLRSIAQGEDLETILNNLIYCIEKQCPDLICSVLSLDKDGKRLLVTAAPNLPQEYNDAVNGLSISPNAGSCGTAAYTGEEVIVKDIENDPLWANYKDLALKFGLRACWSVPIKSENRTLGTFAMYYKTPKAPTEEEMYRIRYGAKLAQIAMEHKRTVDQNLDLQKHLLQLQKMDAIGLFAASIAHDLNNTLTILEGHLHLIISDFKATSEIKRSARMALDGSERSADLAKQLLGFSTRGKYDSQATEIHQLLDENLEYLTETLGCDIQINMDVCNDFLYINCDSQQIKQVFTNVFLNAKRAIENRSKNSEQDPCINIKLHTKNIEVPSVYNRSAEPGYYVVCEITDNGIGIDPDDLDKIFDPFFTTKKAKHIAGIGLATSYGIMQKHGGWITVDSTLNQGSTFSLVFPVAKQVEYKGYVQRKNLEPTHTREQIMIVDDDEMVMQVSLEILRKKGFDIIGFTNPQEALNWFTDNHSSVQTVILDIQMPVMDGEQVFNQLKNIKPEVRILLISAYSQNKKIHKLLKQGADKFFLKPITYHELVETLETKDLHQTAEQLRS